MRGRDILGFIALGLIALMYYLFVVNKPQDAFKILDEVAHGIIRGIKKTIRRIERI